MKTALFLLPHVLLYVLLDGTQDDSEEVGYRVSLDVQYPFSLLKSTQWHPNCEQVKCNS